MDLPSDLLVLFRIMRGMPRHGNLAKRLQSLYAPQADQYDAYRERLLHGRRDLIEMLHLPSGARIAELGAGTGRNLGYFGDERLSQMSSIDLVDICPALLAKARQRANRYSNVHVIETDAARYEPATRLDCVLMSYSLTMMNEWERVLGNVTRILSEDGTLAVIDFTVTSEQHPLVRGFCRAMFAHDGVYLDSRHGERLRTLFPDCRFVTRAARIPYLPWPHIPYFLFVGSRKGQTSNTV